MFLQFLCFLADALWFHYACVLYNFSFSCLDYAANFYRRYPMEIGEGSEMRQGFSSFVSQITLTIPNYDVIVVSGHQRADKKSSYDSACLLMLSELEQRGFLSIAKS